MPSLGREIVVVSVAEPAQHFGRSASICCTFGETAKFSAAQQSLVETVVETAVARLAWSSSMARTLGEAAMAGAAVTFTVKAKPAVVAARRRIRFIIFISKLSVGDSVMKSFCP